jgi:hypothetical protein
MIASVRGAGVPIVAAWVAYAVVAFTLLLFTERWRRTRSAAYSAVFVFLASWMVATATLVFGESWSEAVPGGLIAATLFLLWMTWRSRKRRLSV